MKLNPYTGLPEAVGDTVEQQGMGPLMDMPVVQLPPKAIAARKVQSQNISRGPAQAMPEAPKQNSLIDMIQQSIARRDAEVAALKQQAAKPEESSWADINLKPLLALTDSWNGTNVAASYENPAMKKEMLRQQLLEKAMRADEATSNDRLALAKMLGDDQYKDRRMDNLELLTAITGNKADRMGDLAELKAAKEKLPTGEAFLSGGFARRLEQSQEVMDDLMRKGYMGPTRGDQVRSYLPNELQTDQYKSYDQAERNFINATLRRESGAAISEGEFKNARKQYIPQPGDGPDVLAQKAANRRQNLETFKAQGGNAYDKIQYVSPTKSKTAQNVRANTGTVTVSNGQETLVIPRADLQQALSDGFREVK